MRLADALVFFVFNADCALTSGGFRIVFDTLVNYEKGRDLKMFVEHLGMTNITLHVARHF